MRGIIIVFLFFLLISCKTKMVYVPVERVRTETVTLKDTIVDVRLELIRDSVTVPDSVSYLTNKYAYSWAGMKDGVLSHSLSTWGTPIPVEVKYVEKLIVDSVPVPYEVKVIEYRDKPLTAWQKVRMYIGGVSIILIFVIIGYFIYK
jgi:hypothetical protein